MSIRNLSCASLFFFNDTATTEIYTLSLHDALPISQMQPNHKARFVEVDMAQALEARAERRRRIESLRHIDRKSTRLNSSHVRISYAVFCLKKKHQPRSSAIELRYASIVILMHQRLT